MKTGGRLVKHAHYELHEIPTIRDYAAFLGGSAPRFYYNVNPQEPAANYGQFLVVRQ